MSLTACLLNRGSAGAAQFNPTFENPQIVICLTVAWWRPDSDQWTGPQRPRIPTCPLLLQTKSKLIIDRKLIGNLNSRLEGAGDETLAAGRSCRELTAAIRSALMPTATAGLTQNEQTGPAAVMALRY